MVGVGRRSALLRLDRWCAKANRRQHLLHSLHSSGGKSTSIWSAVNIAKFEQLRAQGRMTPAGERAFASCTEGRSVIYAYEQQSTAELSPEEVRTFKRHKLAWRFFEAIASLGGGLFRARHARARQVQSTSTLELSEVEPRTSATCTSMVIGRTCRFATDPRVTCRYSKRSTMSFAPSRLRSQFHLVRK